MNSIQFPEGPERNAKAAEWFRANPHRLHLGNIGFETFFSVTAASSFVIGQVCEWRKCIGEYDIFRTLYAKVVWVGEKVLAGVPTVKKDA